MAAGSNFVRPLAMKLRAPTLSKRHTACLRKESIGTSNERLDGVHSGEESTFNLSKPSPNPSGQPLLDCPFLKNMWGWTDRGKYNLFILPYTDPTGSWG